MNRPNLIQESIRKGKITFGTFVFLPEPAIVEIIGNCGYDFVILDMEHASLSNSDVEKLIRSAELSGLVPFVRVGKDRDEDILRVLEAGAMGVFIPHVMNGKEMSRVVEAVKYPPEGRRGACRGVRAARYGDSNFAEYARDSNLTTWVVPIVEDAEACENIEEILAVKGINAINPGPGDLSTSLGIPGQTRHPRVISIVDKIIASAKKEGVPVATYVTDASESEEWVKKGVNMIIHSMDTRIIMEAYKRGIVQLRTSIS
jgi:2-keto-3-deoxy-L-rhamnonate aldolase RhmA